MIMGSYEDVEDRAFQRASTMLMDRLAPVLARFEEATAEIFSEEELNSLGLENGWESYRDIDKLHERGVDPFLVSGPTLVSVVESALLDALRKSENAVCSKSTKLVTDHHRNALKEFGLTTKEVSELGKAIIWNEASLESKDVICLQRAAEKLKELEPLIKEYLEIRDDQYVSPFDEDEEEKTYRTFLTQLQYARVPLVIAVTFIPWAFALLDMVCAQAEQTSDSIEWNLFSNPNIKEDALVLVVWEVLRALGKNPKTTMES